MIKIEINSDFDDKKVIFWKSKEDWVNFWDDNVL